MLIVNQHFKDSFTRIPMQELFQYQDVCLSAINGGNFGVYPDIRKHECEGAKIFDMKSAYRIF
jgi:hypothetical protein